MRKKLTTIAVLGCTGSIGQQTLDIVRNFPDRFKIIGLAGGHNHQLLLKQINEFHPAFAYSEGKIELPTGTGFISLEEMAVFADIDLVIIATSGKAGLMPALSAIRTRKRLAIANKEPLVMAGHIIMAEAERYQAQILPIDSEHSAIWQCLNGENNGIARIILTASGGPFYRYDSSQLAGVTVEETLKHPTWKMGKKVTVDSATLMNKGLEAIEAHWLFNAPYSKIDIVIHPKSIIHSMVEFVDGSVKAQLSYPDMHYPIQYALSYPDRIDNANLSHVDLIKISPLAFEPVDFNKFPCLSLALEAGKKAGTYPAVLCASDEVAVELFLQGKIKFTDIAQIVAGALDAHKSIDNPGLDDIVAADIWARKMANSIADKRILCC